MYSFRFCLFVVLHRVAQCLALSSYDDDDNDHGDDDDDDESPSSIIYNNVWIVCIHWTFVEPSAPNYERLQENLLNRSNLCHLQAVNAAVIADTNNAMPQSMTFYLLSRNGLRQAIGKTIPIAASLYITQVSGFSMAPLRFNARQFTKRGLRMQDYVVQTNVTVFINNTYSQLTTQTPTPTPPVLVLIDTEGWDCSIILGMAQDSPYLAQFLIFEHHQCKPAVRQETERYGICVKRWVMPILYNWMDKIPWRYEKMVLLSLLRSWQQHKPQQCKTRNSSMVLQILCALPTPRGVWHAFCL